MLAFVFIVAARATQKSGKHAMHKLATSLTIRDVQVRAVSALLKTPMITAMGSSSKTPLMLIDLSTEQGATGRAYLVAKSTVALKALACRSSFEDWLSRCSLGSGHSVALRTRCTSLHLYWRVLS